jgi:hypothetical protein
MKSRKGVEEQERINVTWIARRKAEVEQNKSKRGCIKSRRTLEQERR